MPDPLERRVVDAVIADLNTNADLGGHLTVPYRRPRAITPEICPVLVVWLLGDEEVPITTEWFGSEMAVGISWHEEAVEEATTLVEDEAVSLALIDALAKIKARLRILTRGGLTTAEEAWQVRYRRSTYLPPEGAQGFTEGYYLEALVEIVER